MFRIICLTCYHHIAVRSFQDGTVSSCPHCGTGAFAEKGAPSEAKREPSQKSPATVETFSFACPHCRRKLKATPSHIGREIPCPACKAKITIRAPRSEEAKSPSRPSPPPDSAAPKKIVISIGDPLDNRSASSVPIPPPRVPTPRVPPSPLLNPAIAFDYPKPTEGVKLPVRMRRLYADVKAVAERLAKSRNIRINKIEGTPPDLYLIEYRVRSIEIVRGRDIVYRNVHIAEIRLTADYPRQAPMCKLLTPLFHPNFAPSHICIGDHWTAGEKLIDLIIRIGEMIAFQSYNVKSPLNGEAAMWAEQHESMLPTDKTELIPPE